ncbi:hypothetical protein L798_05302 [Zootermopsis nevadensis]|uniref:Ionotropic glutamate receptor C-terminal domain-containing protein n=1 Tax=Zootermopsis nevadensis TaxID=136037 RepID=A0A067RHK1_ZOONE|nr:hypothetical protein L798_05302 [Zootermopsis nevadensis]
MMLKEPFVFVMLIYCAAESLDGETSVQFIADYFAYKGAHMITTFTCSSHDARYLMSLTKTSPTAANFWTVSVTAENGNFSHEGTKRTRNVLNAAGNVHGVFLDYGCATNRDIFTQMSDKFLLNASFNWLIWSTDGLSGMENVNLNIDSDVTWATPDTPRGLVLLYDVYKVNYTWPVISTLAGQWNRDNGLVYTLTQFKYLRRGDLQGLLFNAAVAVSDSPGDDIERWLSSPVDRHHMDSIAKYNYALHRQLGDRFNFTMQLHATYSQGYPDSNGQFDGMLGMLQRGEVQLGITSLTMLPQRFEIVDFTGPTWKFRTSVLFRHPRTTGTSYSLLKPFTKTVWLYTLLSWALMMVTIHLVKWLEYLRQRDDHQPSRSDCDHSWGATILTIFGAISEQGTEMESKWMTWRIVYLVTLVQVVLLNAYYGACMVSDLLQPPPRTIHTVRDLINSRLHVGYVDNRHNREYFQDITDPTLKELYSKKMKPPHAFPVSTAIEKLHKEPFAVHDEAISLYPTIEQTFNNEDKCAITEIVLFSPRMTYPVIHKRSPYRRLLSYGFHKLWETGTMARELLMWRPEPPKCQHLDNFYSVDMEGVAVAFLIFVFGVITGSVILFLERLQDFKCFWKKKDE